MRRGMIFGISLIVLIVLTDSTQASYDYTTGRWLTQDPMGYKEGMNLYEYVASSPVKYYDPFGLENWWPLPSDPTKPNLPKPKIPSEPIVIAPGLPPINSLPKPEYQPNFRPQYYGCSCSWYEHLLCKWKVVKYTPRVYRCYCPMLAIQIGIGACTGGAGFKICMKACGAYAFGIHVWVSSWCQRKVDDEIASMEAAHDYCMCMAKYQDIRCCRGLIPGLGASPGNPPRGGCRVPPKCTNYGDCTPEEKAFLDAVVNFTCKGPPRRCEMGDDYPILIAKVALNSACLGARIYRQVKCFPKGDPTGGHDDQIQATINAIRRCTSLLRNKLIHDELRRRWH